jgi:hypothetical protein
LETSREPQDDAFLEEALRIIERARENGTPIRIMGAIAIRLHAKKILGQGQPLKRNITDMDFVGYNNDKTKIETFITESGYDQQKAVLTPGLLLNRLIFFSKKDPSKHIDVFLDQLQMCHTINFRNRLEVDYPTIPLAELLLEKMQIVKINEKDIKDTLALLVEHDIGKGDDETVNAELIAGTLSRDWGFCYTVTTNLSNLKKFTESYAISEEERGIITQRIDKLVQRIESEPKSLKWKMRAKVGTSRKWYEEVEEVERAPHLADLDDRNNSG